MNARAEGFSDSDSLYTKRRTIFTDVNSGTASAERESFPLEDFGGPVFRDLYESDALTTQPRGWIRTDPRDWIRYFALSTWDYNLDALLGRSKRIRHGVSTRSQNYMFVVFPSDSSTLPFPFTRPSEPPILELDWSSCLAGFVDEEIEDGMTASLGEKISNLIRFHGSKAIKQLKDLLTSNDLSPSVASHTLRWLGRIKDSASFDSRLRLLCESLRSKSPVIRDGASLGLAALGSPKAISFLQDAIDQEKLPGLRADMEQVLRELQN
jgi:HEAT repeats